MTNNNVTTSVLYGTLASAILLGVYFALLSLISGWSFAQSQFISFWYFIVSLAIGFGVQIGLFAYLKNLIKNGRGSGRVLGVTGTTSTAAMISCCAHYLVNLLPILGVAGVVTFVAQYQVKLFWVGILFNLGGIAYISNKIFKLKQLATIKYWPLLLPSALIAGLLIYFGFFNAGPRPNENQATATEQPTFAQPDQWDTKTDDRPPVTVSVTPVKLGKDAGSWKFDIALNTHAGSLDQDLMEMATLSDDKGNTYRPTAWAGPAPGGHHREGVLVFNAILPMPQSVEIKIKNIGGIPERSFKWHIE